MNRVWLRLSLCRCADQLSQRPFISCHVNQRFSNLSVHLNHAEGFFFFFFLIYFIYLFIYLFIFGCAGSSVRARAFSSCGKWGPLFIAVRGPPFIAVRRPLTIAAPPVAGHRLQTRRLSSCGSRAQLYASFLRHILINYSPPSLTMENMASHALSVMKEEYTSVGRGLSFQYKRKKIANTFQQICF